MAKPREKVPSVELSSAFQKKADLELQRLREIVARHLKEEMIGLLEDEIHADLLITNGIVSVRAHKCIVQARSRHLWQESWLTQKHDPDTSSDISCIEMSGLNGEQLTQFARQLYSVSDAALLLEEYINYMPRGKESCSHLEAERNSITPVNLHQPEMEGNSNSFLLAGNIGGEPEKEHVSSERTSDSNDGEDGKMERSDLSVEHHETVDNDNENNTKNIFGSQMVHTDSQIVSLPDVHTDSKIVSLPDVHTDSKIVSLPDVLTESKIGQLPDFHTESKVVCSESKIVSSSDVSAENKILCTESKMAQAESKIVSSPDVDTESKIVSLPDVHTESKVVCTESKFVLSADIPTHSEIVPLLDVHAENKTTQTESKVTQAESKVISSPDVHTESKVVSSPDVRTESKVVSSPDVHGESKVISPDVLTKSMVVSSPDVRTETKVVSSPDVRTESKVVSSPVVRTESKVISSSDVLTESKVISSPDVRTESKVVSSPDVRTERKVISSSDVLTESKVISSDVLTESKIVSSSDVHIESKVISSPDVHTESKTAHTESKVVSSPDVHTESKTAHTESKVISSPDVHTESKTAHTESKVMSSPDVHTESKTAHTESKVVSSPDVHTESKTAHTESKVVSSPDVHTESKTAHTESKVVSSPDVHTESKTAHTESKVVSSPDVHTESKTAHTESKVVSSPDVHTESKTAHTESKVVSSPDVHAESKTAHTESKVVSSPDVHTESKTAHTESKVVSSPDVHTESKTAHTESKVVSSPDVHTENKTTHTESKVVSSPDVHTESKTAHTESKVVSSPDVHTESKTAHTESKVVSSPDVHTESKTAHTESKVVSSPDVHTESKTAHTESKVVSSPDVHTESKTAHTESKVVSSPDVHTESKTAHTESKVVSSPDIHTESKTAHTESKVVSSPDVHTESKTAHTESKVVSSPDVHTESKTAHTESKVVSSPDVHTESKTAHTESKVVSSPDVHTESKTAHTESKVVSSPDVHTESKTAHTESKVISSSSDVHTESKTAHTESKTAHTENKTVHTESKFAQVEPPTALSTQISEDFQASLSNSSHEGGTEPADLQVHPEGVLPVCSDNVFVKPQVVDAVIDISIVEKDRLELMNYIQLEAQLASSTCLADGSSVDFCVGEDLLNSDMSESFYDNIGKDADGSGDGYMQTSSKILIETADHEKASFCDLVTADSDSEQYETCSSLGRDLLSMYLHKDNCDCCLSVDGVHFMAHKCVLSARCEYFLAMFGGQWSESQMATVNLEAVSPQAVKQLLLFLYGGVINLCVPSNLKELFVIADMYGVLTFRTVLMFYVKKDLCHFFHKPCPACVTTTSEALVLCHIFHLEDLQARCLKWMAKYFTKIWPTKTFSNLEDSIHQLCFESILSQMTASNVLDIIIECNKLISSLPRIKWTETVLYLVTRLMDAAIEYTSSHFVDVLKTKEFLLWAKVASWKASVLEEIFYSVIDSLPVDTACLVFQTLMKLQDFHSNPENPDLEITALLQAMMKCCEKFFRTHIHHVTRSKQWFVLPQQIQSRILEMSAYVYLPEPHAGVSSKQTLSSAHRPQAGKHERTLPIGIAGPRSRAGASFTTISAPARTGLATKTSPHSGRRLDKSRSETRMSRSVSESLPSGGKKTGSSLKGIEIKVRAVSRDRQRTDVSDSLGGSDNQSGGSLFDPKLTSARDENQGSVPLNARHFGYQSSSQGSRPGSYFLSKSETKIDEVRSEKVEVTEKVLEGEGHGSSQRLSNSLKLALSSQSKSSNGTKKLSPVGQKSHMISKLPILIRSQRQSHRQHLVCSTHDEVMAPECSSSTSIEVMPSECPAYTSSVIMSSECPSTDSSEMIPSENVTTSASIGLVSTNTVSEGSTSAASEGSEDKDCTLPAAVPVVDEDTFSHQPVISPESVTTPDKDFLSNLSQGISDHLTQPSDSNEQLSDNLHKVTSLDEPENSNSNSQELSTAETIATLDFSSYASDAILSDRTGDEQGHLTAGLETSEVQAEVKIVHMSKTLNVGFIVPPD